MKKALLCLMFFLAVIPAWGDQRIYGNCEVGNTTVNTQGFLSTNVVQGSFPSCTVTVYNTGTLVLATIYADNSRTVKANPFTASSNGQWFFYASSGSRVDVQMSGGSPAFPSNTTLGDVEANDIGVGPIVNQCAVSFSATPTFTATNCAAFSMTLTGNVTSSSITGGTAGQIVVFSLSQGAGGPWTFAWPASFLNPPLLTPTAAKNEQCAFILLADTNWHSLGCGESVVFDTAVNGNVLKINGTTVSAVTGTGSAVLATSPSISGPTITGGGSLSGTFSGTSTFSGNLTFTGLDTFSNIFNVDNIKYLDGTNYTTLATCYAAIPAGGGVCVVPPNYTETLAASIVMTSGKGFEFKGPAAITMVSNTITCASPCRGAFIRGIMDTSGRSSPQGTVFTYTGSGTAISFGDTSNDSSNVYLEHFSIQIPSAGNAAQALTWTRMNQSEINDVFINGAGASSSQIGFTIDGQATCACQNSINSLRAQNLLKTISIINDANANTWSDIGAQSNTTSGIGIDFECGGGNCPQENFMTGVLDEDSATGIKFGAGVPWNQLWVQNDSSITTDVLAVAGSNNNLALFTHTPVISDSGTANKFALANFLGPSILSGGCNGTASAATTIFLNQLGSSVTACTNTAGTIKFVFPFAGTLHNLYCVAGTGGVGAGSGVVTLSISGTSGNPTCTFGTNTTCNDTTNNRVVTAGATGLFQITTQGGETLANVSCSVEIN